MYLLIKHLIFVLIFFVSSALADEKFFGSGDRKHNYDKETYITNSLSVTSRKGKSIDLMQYVENPPLGLPAVIIPESNHITREKIQLGRRLFFDRRLSLNDTFSCATCHIPEQGFTNNEISTAVGFEGRSGKRNSPTIYNVAYLTKLFHDGREDSLEQQTWSPLLASNEMANPSIGHVINKIKGIPDYDGLFESAFNGKGVTMETVSDAFASYQRTLNSANSRFDRWYYGNEEDVLNEDEKEGFNLFMGKAKCASCHLVNKDHAIFTDKQMHNTGYGYEKSMSNKSNKTKVQLAPGMFVYVDNKIIESVSKQKQNNDLGLYSITQNPHDRWKFRTPTLRNVALTAPYMHDGAFSTLREVIDFYNRGGVSNELLSPLITPLNLSEREIEQVIVFMNTLTGDNVKDIVADAFDAPIGDLSQEDPNWAHE